jgi:heterodisulfide reductase subunit A
MIFLLSLKAELKAEVKAVSMKKIYKVENGCTICGMCVVVCPRKAITLGPGGAKIDENLCVGCGACKFNCASEAIKAYEARE